MNPQLSAQTNDEHNLSQAPNFSKKVFILMVILGILSLGTWIWNLVFESGAPSPHSAAADTFSVSATGHQAFSDLLIALDIPVGISRHGTNHGSQDGALLILAEPDIQNTYSEKANGLREMLRADVATLIVLPKWYGETKVRRQEWLDSIQLRPSVDAENVLNVAHHSYTWKLSRSKQSSLAKCQSAKFSSSVSIPHNLQLIRDMPSSDTKALISCGESGALLVEVNRPGRTAPLWILSDPDLLNTHGLRKGDNALLAVNIIEALRGPKGLVIFDETLHGHLLVPSITRELLSFPLSLPFAQWILLALTLLWAGLGRFGAPLNLSSKPPSGGRVLVESGAKIQELGAHSTLVLERYLHDTLELVGQRLHAPHSTPKEMLPWLKLAAERRGTAIDLVEIIEDLNDLMMRSKPSPQKLLMLAQRLYLWRVEMLDEAQ